MIRDIVIKTTVLAIMINVKRLEDLIKVPIVVVTLSSLPKGVDIQERNSSNQSFFFFVVFSNFCKAMTTTFAFK